ncbi:PIGM mannosyltransferase, partial [Polyodon spathula]|nr:PIGM mannosyltransferase [Polyodon spathula]
MAAYLTTDWTLAFLKKRILFSTAFLIRIVLVFYGVYQDKTMLVKYTDIDYHVFTDASRFITQGSSPYKRATYRYTPLLAWILIPNIYLTALFGKLLFVICDVISAYLMYSILHFRGMGNDKACRYCALWLLNPLPIAVSSRGNAESVLVVLVVATLYYMESRSLVKAAVCYGLSVHMKIYPVTYALPIALSLQTLKDPETEALGNKASPPLSKRIHKIFSRLLNRDLLVFAVTAGGTFSALSLIFYSMYGWEFLEHTYLYHLTRRDIRHNFSAYFYMLYLSVEKKQSKPNCISVGTNLQETCRYLLLNALAYELCFIFIFFKAKYAIIVLEYFLWYLCLLPLVLPSLTLSLKQGLGLLFLWFAAQGLWLAPAYYLEFEGHNTFLLIWLAGLFFLFINSLILVQIISHYKQWNALQKTKSV